MRRGPVCVQVVAPECPQAPPSSRQGTYTGPRVTWEREDSQDGDADRMGPRRPWRRWRRRGRGSHVKEQMEAAGGGRTVENARWGSSPQAQSTGAPGAQAGEAAAQHRWSNICLRTQTEWRWSRRWAGSWRADQVRGRRTGGGRGCVTVRATVRGPGLTVRSPGPGGAELWGPCIARHPVSPGKTAEASWAVWEPYPASPGAPAWSGWESGAWARCREGCLGTVSDTRAETGVEASVCLSRE